MKTYVQGIIFGILSILSVLLFTGIPFGTELIEIVDVAVLVIGVFAVLIMYCYPITNYIIRSESQINHVIKKINT